mgnify:CR=1 FL=1
MNTNTTRRAAFLGAGAIALTACLAPSVAAMPEDPIISLINRHEQHLAACPGFSGAEDKRWNDTLRLIEDEMRGAMPSTTAGALAALRFVRKECQSFELSDLHDALMGAAIDILAREA